MHKLPQLIRSIRVDCYDGIKRRQDYELHLGSKASSLALVEAAIADGIEGVFSGFVKLHIQLLYSDKTSRQVIKADTFQELLQSWEKVKNLATDPFISIWSDLKGSGCNADALLQLGYRMSTLNLNYSANDSHVQPVLSNGAYIHGMLFENGRRLNIRTNSYRVNTK
tara:strand:+ start:3119 stop:3619 length:501 start_codon:yes stop_codon:yes gene_type:complete